MKLLCIATALCALSSLAWGDAKSAASASDVFIVRTLQTVPPNGSLTYNSGWITVSTTQIQPPGGKDLLVTFSAVTTAEVYGATGNAVFGTNSSGTFTFTEPSNALYARILVDGVPATPGYITLDSQFRYMDAFVANPILGCTEVDPSGLVGCTFTTSFYADLFSTSAAHAFTFVMRNVSPQNHVIQAQVLFSLNAFTTPITGFNTAFTAAAIGSRTLIVEQLALDK
jgi:hypothetical protein